MKQIHYSKHARTRFALRNIPIELVEAIYRDAENRFTDKQTNYNVAVKRVQIHGQQREMMVAYEEQDDKVVIVTAHLLKAGQKENRIAIERWVKL